MSYWQQFDKMKAHEKALKSALVCTISGSLATLLAALTHQESSLIYILSSTLFVLFRYGETVNERVCMILIGGLCAATSALIAASLHQVFILALILVMLVSFVTYFYSFINEGFIVISKVATVFMCFAILPSQNNIPAINLFLQIIAGTCTALTIYWLYYQFKQLFSPHSSYKDWLSSFQSNLHAMSGNIYRVPQTHLKSLSLLYSEQMKKKQPEIAILVDSTTNLLYNIAKCLKGPQHSLINTHYGELLKQYLSTLEKALNEKNTHLLKDIHLPFEEKNNTLRALGFFSRIRLNTRSQIAYFHFILFILKRNIARIIELNLIEEKTYIPQDRFSLKTFLESIVTAIKKQTLYVESGDGTREFSVNSKIAIRASVALSLAYIVTYFGELKYGSWVMITANLVLLVKQGATIKKAWDRIAGHVCGFLLAIPFGSLIWVKFSNPFFWVPVLIFISIYTFQRLYFFFSMTLMVVMLYLYTATSAVGFGHFNHIDFMTWRLVDTLTGAFISLLMSFLIFPKTAYSPIKAHLKKSLIHLRNYIEKNITLLNPQNKDTVLLSKDHDALIDDYRLNELEQNCWRFQADRFNPDYYRFNRFLEKQAKIIDTLLLMTQIISTLKNDVHRQQKIDSAICTFLISITKVFNSLISDKNDDNDNMIELPDRHILYQIQTLLQDIHWL